MASKIEHDAELLAARGPGTGCWGESDDLPQSESPSGMQAVCCLSPRFVIGPGDQSLGESVGNFVFGPMIVLKETSDDTRA